MERRLQVLADLRRVAVELEHIDLMVGFSTGAELDRLASERDFLVDARKNLQDEAAALAG